MFLTDVMTYLMKGTLTNIKGVLKGDGKTLSEIGVDEAPTTNSKNLVESGGVKSALAPLENAVKTSSTGISMTSASGVTLSNVRFDYFGLIFSGYCQVITPGNGTTTLGTLGNNMKPRVTVYFPAWRSNTYEFAGIVSIDTDGVVTFYPATAYTGNRHIAFTATFVLPAT